MYIYIYHRGRDGRRLIGRSKGGKFNRDKKNEGAAVCLCYTRARRWLASIARNSRLPRDSRRQLIAFPSSSSGAQQHRRRRWMWWQLYDGWLSLIGPAEGHEQQQQWRRRRCVTPRDGGRRCIKSLPGFCWWWRESARRESDDTSLVDTAYYTRHLAWPSKLLAMFVRLIVAALFWPRIQHARST